jgi:AraC family transcriptional regulator
MPWLEENYMQAEFILSDHRAYTIETRLRSVKRVITAMRERLGEPLSMKELSTKIAYASPFHFNRVFHQVTGIPPSQFLYALRLETAKQLLLTTDQSVTDVCYEVGYNSLGTFTKRFTQLVGLSPCRLRRLTKQFSASHLDFWIDKNQHASLNTSSQQMVSGQINNPANFSGIIFVGLFRTCIPQGLPEGGTLLTSPGTFHIGPLPEGRYFAFAAAFPYSTNPLSYLLPKPESLFVGVGQGPITVRKGVVQEQAQITLRPMQITDPPILVALPYLLEKQMAG